MSVRATLLASVFALAPALTAHALDASAIAPADLFDRPASTSLPAAAAPAKAVDAQRSGPATPFVLERFKPANDEAVGETEAVPRDVDVSALRYYASQNDLPRVSAEIRLLRAKNPNWEPPADLFTDVQSSADEQPLWDQFAKHDLAGLKAAIDDMRQKKPDWQPSADLTTKIALAEARDTLVAASNDQRWADVIATATENRGLLTCSDVDSLWRTAEALVKGNDEPRAVEAYRYILKTCSRPQERVATVQKASLLLPPEDFASLLSLGRRGRDGRDEFDSVRLDLVRRTIGDAAAGKAETEPSQKDIDAIASAFTKSHAAADAQLLGWSFYAKKDFPKAETWFRSGMAAKPEPKAAEGLVLALRGQNKMPEAEDLAFANRDLDAPNRKVFIELTASLLTNAGAPTTLKPEVMAGFEQAVETAQSPEGAQALGWHLYSAKNLAGAESWFRKSMDWQANENAAIGLMICAKRLKHERDYADLVAKFRGQFSRVAELEKALQSRGGGGRVHVARSGGRAVHHGRRGAPAGAGDGGWDANADAIVSTFKAGQYDQALAMLDARKGTRGEPHGLSVVRGWAQYHRGDWTGAQQTFGSLEQRSPSTDSETGLRVIREGYLPPRFR